MKIVNIAMSVLTISLCIVLIYYIGFTQIFADRLDGFKKPMMLAILCVYGVYRSFMLYLYLKRKNRSSKQ